MALVNNDRVKLAAYRVFDPHQIGLLGGGFRIDPHRAPSLLT
jgi:hypothetical protein